MKQIWLKSERVQSWLRPAVMFRVLALAGFLAGGLASLLPWAPKEQPASSQPQPAVTPPSLPSVSLWATTDAMEWAWKHNLEWVDVQAPTDRRNKSKSKMPPVEAVRWAWKGDLSAIEHAWSAMQPQQQWGGVITRWELRSELAPGKAWVLSVEMQPFAAQSWPAHDTAWPVQPWVERASVLPTVEAAIDEIAVSQVQRWRYLGWAGTMHKPKVWLQTSQSQQGWRMGQPIDGSSWSVERLLEAGVVLKNSTGDTVELRPTSPKEQKR